MIVVDTSELRRPVQRKLHAAWWELADQQVLATRTVANELAPLGADPTAVNGRSAADALLASAGPETSEERLNEVEQQAWWATMWRSPDSPYRIVPLTEEQEGLTRRLLEKIDRRCFPTTDPGDIDRSGDARIVCEAAAIGAKMLLTSNMRTIDRTEVNRWAVENGEALGFKPEPVLFHADATLVSWTTEPAQLERWIQAGMMACWPRDDDAPTMTIIDRTLKGIGAMSRGTGGKLQDAAARLVNGLEQHADPEGLVQRTRARLPSATIETDRFHPTYPHAGGSGAPVRPSPVAVYRRSQRNEGGHAQRRQ